MTLRKVASYDEARILLDELKKTPEQTLPEFCSKRGLDGRSLHCWRRNIENMAIKKQDEKTPQSLRLVGLELPTVHVPTKYRILLGDEVVVEIDDTFQEQTLSRLLKVLEGRC